LVSIEFKEVKHRLLPLPASPLALLQPPEFILRLAIRTGLMVVVLHVFAAPTQGTPLNEYRQRLEQAVSALDTLGQFDEGESEANRALRTTETIAAVRRTVPETDSVEWDGTVVRVDNSWLHRELQGFEKVEPAARGNTLKEITERLQAVAQRLAEIDRAKNASGLTKAEARQKLTEILQRPEYVRSQQNPVWSRLLDRFLKWLLNLFPKPKLSPGRANLFSLIAQIVVVLLAVGVIVYAIRMFAPRFFKGGRAKRKKKRGPRIVLGEKLEPDQSAVDLLAEAEALAQRGELRAAIRKAYIALLVELGERKIISLAQHKTNRDYLGAVRERESLYAYVKQLTDSFERHWYGFANATDADWHAFRDGYKQALTQ
jgi:hypothetical protein